jgi:hypothetical protein
VVRREKLRYNKPTVMLALEDLANEKSGDHSGRLEEVHELRMD